MIDESMDTEQMALPPQPWEFRSKPAWQRLIIMLGGVFVNFVLGILIYICLMWAYGEKFLPNENVKDGVWVQDSLAMNVGLETGDKILTIDGEKIRKFNDITLGFINGNNFQIERKGAIIDKAIPEDFISKLIDRRKNAQGPIVSARIPFMIGEIPDDSQNKNTGIKVKDLIVKVDGKDVTYYDEIETYFSENKGKKVNLSVKRDANLIDIKVDISDKGKLGVFAANLKLSEIAKLGYYDLAEIEYSFTEAIPAGLNKSWKTLTDYVKQLKKIFNPSTGAYKGLGGFISIGSIFPDEWSAQAFWNITAFLSIMLGFMNLLPIPALDGGHVVFTLWEMITGKKPGDKFLEYAQVVGFILLIALLLFANGNDIYRSLFR
jgi:regulator of sigma E protease